MVAQADGRRMRIESAGYRLRIAQAVGVYDDAGEALALAERLGYPAGDLDRVPASAIQSFAGVGYPFAANVIHEGDTVLDVGSGSLCLRLFVAGLTAVAPQAAAAAPAETTLVKRPLVKTLRIGATGSTARPRAAGSPFASSRKLACPARRFRAGRRPWPRRRLAPRRRRPGRCWTTWTGSRSLGNSVAGERIPDSARLIR